MSAELLTQMEAQADAARRDIGLLNALGEYGTVADIPPGAAGARRHALDNLELDPDADYLDALDVIALEVYARATIRPGDTPAVVDAVIVVTGTGGPHTETRLDEHGHAVTTVIWGAERIERSAGTAPAAAERLFEIFEEARQ